MLRTHRPPALNVLSRDSRPQLHGLVRGMMQANPPPACAASKRSRNENLFDSNPDARRAIAAATGLTAEGVDRVTCGLSAVGLALTLRPNADSDARYAHAVSLVRVHGYSLYAAAREAGLDPSNFNRRLKRNNEKIPDAETRHKAAEERILSLSENLSETAAEKLLVDIESNRLKPGELVKTFSAATNQVAAKRRWNQGLGSGDDRTQDALADALLKLRAGYSVQIKPPDPANQAIDITPSDEAGETTGAQ